MFAKEAAKHRAEFPELSNIYHRIASDKLVHADMLAVQAKSLAGKEHKMDVWDVEDYMIRHDMTEIRRCLDGYK